MIQTDIKSFGEFHSGNSNLDEESTTLEGKNRLNFQISILAKEEVLLEEELRKLDQLKPIYKEQHKRFLDEENCRFSKSSSELTTWPLLANRYQIVCLIGKGGFGEVYKAYDLDAARETAVKIHQLNPQWSEKTKQSYIKHALRENQIHQKLSHPNIIMQYDTLELDCNSFCTVLEYCEGQDLSQYLKKMKVLPEKEAKQMLYQICLALQYLHTCHERIIHYDLKPQNILLSRSGEVKVSDFGLSKILEPEATSCDQTSFGVGTY
eukprot:TRINITY_DN7665_c0_g3_i1.p2 TRINITY_DN7665_c0_g3~~TRINITY_DN7665_c0_g3_i1.p2  ORF type:complete len:265 (+),score=24.25 TRINITY_DN7665_c0_g3_i1:178-972(+)